MAISVIAAITDIARSYIANMTITGVGFKITSFVVGSGGSDPGDSTVPLSPDPSLTVLPSMTFGPKALVLPTPTTSGTLLTPFCPQFQALLDYTEANGAVSNYGLMATPNATPTNPTPTPFLFAIGNTPLKQKTDSDQLQVNITLQT